MATYSSILAWKNPMDRGAWWAIPSMGSQRVGHDWEADNNDNCYIPIDSVTLSFFYFSRSGQHLSNKGLHLQGHWLNASTCQWADVGMKQAESTHAITPLREEWGGQRGRGRDKHPKDAIVRWAMTSSRCDEKCSLDTRYFQLSDSWDAAELCPSQIWGGEAPVLRIPT